MKQSLFKPKVPQQYSGIAQDLYHDICLGRREIPQQYRGFALDLCDIPARAIPWNYQMPKVTKVVFNDPATIVYWSDGTKTVVKVHNEAFDKEKGLAMAMAKRMNGDNYKSIFKKWCQD